MSATDTRLYYAATGRNRAPILEVLRTRIAPSASILEIASGSGEHAVHFCAAEPGWRWQPSDPDPSCRASIAAWVAHTGLDNVLPPVSIDVCAPAWGVEAQAPFDAIACMNMIHIAPWVCTPALFEGAERLLGSAGLVYLYGPFMRGSAHTAPSNEAFDADLRRRNPAWGVRDLDAVAHAAAAHGFTLAGTVDMPANNLSVLFRRAARVD
ncbi:MAG: DUF938 domain-containing protein [Gammaproteobacteria bacterium]